MPNSVGRIIAGRYFLDEPIGRGGMGIVWRAYDQVLHREVAVKEVTVPAAMGEDESAAYQRTLREVQTVARLDHPNIVTIYDVAEGNGRLWIVMELIPSGSLEERIASARKAAQELYPSGRNSRDDGRPLAVRLRQE